ncbi:MAG: hypothetical protein ABGW78_06485 [Pirellulales bacterium]
MSLQKSFSKVGGGSTYKAGDTIEYQLNFQVSDYFALNNVTLEDILSDGQELDTSFTPTISFQQQANGNNFTDQPFDPGNVTGTINGNGTQTVVFDISEQLKALRLLPDGRMLGAAIPFQGTQSGTPDPNTTVTPGTTGTVIFRAKILDEYRTTPAPNAEVVEGDVMTDTASMTAAVLDYSDALTPTGSNVTDGSQKSFTLANGKTEKTLYAINGSPSIAGQRVAPGDLVTFRLTYQLPFSSIKDYKIVDYLPLPIFDPTSDLTWNGQGPSNAAPAVGKWSFGPTDTFSQAPIANPAVNNGNNPGPAVLNAGANSLTWDFGTFADPQDRPSVTDILFTVEATNKPFGDGLLLTNQGQQSEVNQEGTPITSSPGIAQIVVAEPELTITKGVVSTTNGYGEFTQGGVTGPKPPLPNNVRFFEPGTPGLSFTGDITSGPPAGLDATPIDATLSNVVGNDLVKFSIVVENTGSSPNGAFDVTIADTLDPYSRYQIPTNVTGLNLQVTDGVGTSLAYVGDLFSGGITLIDQGPSIASDNAANYQAQTYTPSSPPPNNGTGLNTWVIVAPTSQAGGSFVGPTALSTTTGTNTFGVTSDGNSENAAIRFFQQSLSDGQAFSADVAVNDFNNGTKGFGFHAVGDLSDMFTIRLFVEAGTGYWKYKLSNSATITDTTIPFVANAPIKVRVEQISGTSVVVSMQQAGSPTWSTTLPVQNRLDAAGFSSLGSSPQSNIGFDNLEITGAATQGALGPGTFTDGTVINDGKTIAVITYDLQIDPNVSPLDIIPNTGTVENYASTEGGPNFANRLVDDAIVTIQGPEITKTLIGTDIVDHFNSNTQAVIGEVATFKLDVGIPRGTTRDAIVVDNFPAGLAFKEIVSTTTDPDVSLTGSLTPVVTNDGTRVAFNLGNITNASTSNDLKGFSIEYKAVVLNVRGNTAGTKLRNTAGLAWTSPTGGSLPPVQSDPITVIEPTIEVTKTVNPSTAQAGDLVTFVIDVTAKDTTAYDVELDDILDGELKAEAKSLVWVSGKRPTKLLGTSNGSFEAEWDTLNPGETSRLQFVARVQPGVILGKSISNTANAQWTSLGDNAQITPNNPNAYQRTGKGNNGLGEENDYRASGSAAVTVLSPIVDKKLISTEIINADNTKEQAVIGETATYKITVTIPQGKLEDAELTDRFYNKNLAYVSSTAPKFSSGLTVQNPARLPVLSPNQKFAIWDFGDIENNDTNSATLETISWEVTTLVLNVNTNTNGTTVRNDARMKWSSFETNWKKNSELKVIEPKLTTTKSVLVGNLGGNPGDPVTYTIVIEQDPTSATDAVNTTLTDIIPAEIDSPVLTSVDDSANKVTTTNFALIGNSLTTAIPFDFEKDPAGRTITVKIDGTLQGTFSAGQKINNKSTIKWASIDKTGPILPNLSNSPNNYPRTGSHSITQGELNNYTATSDVDIAVNTVDLQVEKTVNDPTPNVGDKIRFTVTVTNLGPDTATNISLKDTFPVTPELTLDMAGITVSQGTYDSGTGVWDIGSLVNGASVTLKLPATVNAPASGIPSPQKNEAKILTVAEPDSNDVNNEASATLQPKYADLEVIKTTSDPKPNDGETVTYTIKLTNRGKDTATNVELTDVLPSPVDYVANSAIAPAGTTFTPTSTTPGGPITGGTWSVPSIPPTLQASDALVLTFDVIARAGNLSYNTISITKKDTYDPILSNNSSKTSIDPQDADLEVDKKVDNPTPQVGADVVFTVTVTNNGPNTAKDVVVNDLLPAGLTYQSHVADAGTYVPGTGVWTVPDMPLNTSYDLQITATVGTPSSTSGPGATFTNVATGHTSTTDPNPGNETGKAFVTPLQSDLVVEKHVFDPAPNIGDTIQFLIAAANYGPSDATQVKVTDVIPVGLTYVGPTAGVIPNPSDGSVNYDSSTRKLTWDIGSLQAGSGQPGAVPVFVFDATVDAPASGGTPPEVTNTASITGREHDPDTTNNSSSVKETPQYADLVVNKQVSDATPNVGDIITYTITVTNNGKDDADNVLLTDNLRTLSGLSIVGTPTSSAGSFDPATGIWTIGTVYVNTPVTLSVNAEVLAPTSGIPQPQTNTATITGATQYDPDTTNNSHSATETPQYADLEVTKNVNVPNPNVGDNVVFQIIVENLDNDPATGVKIDDQLPQGLTFLSTSSPDYDPATGIWNVGIVNVGKQKAQSLLITATVAASGTFTNVAAVSTTNKPDQFDPDLTNNTGSATVITREADLLVTKTVDDPTPNVGDLITFTVDVTNNGPDSANNVQITDSFPASGLTFVSATPSQGSYDDSTGIWDIGTIDYPSNNKQTLTIQAYVDAPAPDTVPQPQTNEAEVTRVNEHDPDPLNNIGSATETPKFTDLRVDKESTNAQPNVGDTFMYTVTLTNGGNDTATNVEVTEYFPNNISVLSVSPTDTHTTTRWNLNPAGDGGVWSVPTIAPGMFETLVIHAKATSASVADNTVTITHSDVWDPWSKNNTANTPTNPQQADVKVIKTVDNPRPEVDDQVTFTITVENLGPTDAQDVSVTDQLPTGLSWRGDTPSVGTYDENTGIWTIGTLASQSTVHLDIYANVDQPVSGVGSVSQSTNLATVTSTTVDPNQNNNTDTATVTPLEADLAITKTASDSKPLIGTIFDYTIEVANHGRDTASNVFVVDHIPAGDVQVQSINESAGTYNQGTGIWDIGTMLVGERQTLTITVLVTIGNSGGTIINTGEVDSGTWDPDRTNNTDTATVIVPPRGIIVGTDIGCETGPFVRVLDPDSGADRITPFFAYEPAFRGGVRVYGADVTGDNEPDIITAPGPGRPGEVKVWEIINGIAVENPAYSFFPFGPSYTGGIEISEGSITAAGKTEIVAAQNFGGLVSVFEVTPGAANPINTTPVRQLRPFGSNYLGGVTIDTADIGGVSGGTVVSTLLDGITELFVGSGFGIQAQVKGYNGTTASPTLFNAFNVMSPGYNRGVSVARLPSSTPQFPDKILVSSGINGNAQVETYSGTNSVREAAFQAYGDARTQVFSAAIDDQALFSVQGLLGTSNGVQKTLDPYGSGKSTLPQSTVAYPPLRVAILRN